jgi:membrane protease YdiL (CAAX protease family)
VLAFRDVLAIPVKIIQEGGEYLIYSPVSREYSILIAIQYLSCIFLSVAFWRQSNTAQFLRDKFRLRILAVTLGVAGVVLGLLPFTQGGTGVLTKNQSIQLSVAFLFLALFLAITLFIKPRQQSK